MVLLLTFRLSSTHVYVRTELLLTCGSNVLTATVRLLPKVGTERWNHEAYFRCSREAEAVELSQRLQELAHFFLVKTNDCPSPYVSASGLRASCSLSTMQSDRQRDCEAAIGGMPSLLGISSCIGER